EDVEALESIGWVAHWEQRTHCRINFDAVVAAGMERKQLLRMLACGRSTAMRRLRPRRFCCGEDLDRGNHTKSDDGPDERHEQSLASSEPHGFRQSQPLHAIAETDEPAIDRTCDAVQVVL